MGHFWTSEGYNLRYMVQLSVAEILQKFQSILNVKDPSFEPSGGEYSAVWIEAHEPVGHSHVLECRLLGVVEVDVRPPQPAETSSILAFSEARLGVVCS
jgi:hypothetical protein